MRAQHDVVVVGARCAGAATAMLLARLGHDVLLLDRAPPASDTVSTHGLARGGVVQLLRWGLLDAVLATGAPPIRQVVFRLGDAEVSRPVRDRAGVDLLVAPRRHILDGLLASAAERSGALLRSQVTVVGVRRAADGRVAGVTYRSRDGAIDTAGARFVVAADGVHSRLAPVFGADLMAEHPTHSGTFYCYVAGLDFRGYEFHVGESARAGVFPTHAGEACVWVCAPTAEVAALRGAGARRTAALIELIAAASPVLGERIGSGRITSGVRGTVGLPNRIRRPIGPGWALVGDAGYYRDPITAHGMTDAFRDAELLARAIEQSLRDPGTEVEAMTAFQQTRDAALRRTFELTCAMTEHPAADRFVELQKQLSAALEVEADQLAALPPVPPARAEPAA
jgi:2-polyprenyl-6-methoxyphenol hydroxylase-like FAD-dependent oxidoreductase